MCQTDSHMAGKTTPLVGQGESAALNAGGGKSTQPTHPREQRKLQTNMNIDLKDEMERLKIVYPFYTPDFRRAVLTPGTWLYLIECMPADYYYVGISSDIGRRLEAHFFGWGGAKFTKLFGVRTMRPIEVFADIKEAYAAETKLTLELRRAGYHCAGGGYHCTFDLGRARKPFYSKG